MCPHISLAHVGKHPILIRASVLGVLPGWEIQNMVQMACLSAQTSKPLGLASSAI